MQDVIEYLEMKNHYYEKFYSLTRKFLDQVNNNHWADLDLFVDNRERLLNIIRSFDHKISRAMDGNKDASAEQHKLQVTKLLERRTEIANKIVAIDLELISKIDDYKSETIRELKRTVENEQQVQAFTKAASRQTKVKDV